MGTDSVSKQMHQKTVQHYWVNIVKQHVTRGVSPTLRDTLSQPTTQQNAEVQSIITKDR